ncbi:MAG: hydrogenase maturation protein [Gammaproteobacteria bacterium]|nr:hydrogenase maturation protein [Gammaproteobacteria bacterium]
MRVLFLCHAFNSLSQRLFIELRAMGHEVSVELDINDAVTGEAVVLFRPDLVVAPFLKRAIPEAVWRAVPCFVVHPGVPGDRGPAALDWAIMEDAPTWGVTVLQATADMDAGPIWASAAFPMRPATKSSLYRNEVTAAAVAAVRLAVERFEGGGFTPLDQDDPGARLAGRSRPAMGQQERAIHWERDDTATVLRKIRAADGMPGVRDRVAGRLVYLHDVRAEGTLGGRPGELVARSGPAVCRATRDGAVWLGHLRDPQGEFSFKLPAMRVLGDAAADLPEVAPTARSGYRDMYCRRRGPVAYLHWDLYNGAMGVDACERLGRLYAEACQGETRVVVLMGGDDFWSNGMDLNLIEAAASPPQASWDNINAINDLAHAIITTGDTLTIAALGANAGAGGVFLSRAADRVWARHGVVLNPHYKDMGNLYGSEYWTYLLPRYAGADKARRISAARLPMGVEEARALGLVDRMMTGAPEDFRAEVGRRALELANAPDFEERLEAKAARRRADEAERPLADHRRDELAHMHLNFFGFDPSYHVARYNFVHKVPKSHTPLTIARHRRRDWRLPAAEPA